MKSDYETFLTEIVDECLLDAAFSGLVLRRTREVLLSQYVDNVLFCSTDYKDTAKFLYGMNDGKYYYIVSFCVQDEYVHLVYDANVYDSRKWISVVLDELKATGVSGEEIGRSFVKIKNLGKLVFGVFHDSIRSKRKSVNQYSSNDFVYPSYDVLKTYYECGRKVSFATFGEAQTKRDISGRDDEHKIYACKYCGGYHIGREKLAGSDAVPDEVMLGRYKTAWRRYQNI